MRWLAATNAQPGDIRIVWRFLLLPRLLPFKRHRQWRWLVFAVIQQQAVRAVDSASREYLTWEDREWV